MAGAQPYTNNILLTFPMSTVGHGYCVRVQAEKVLAQDRGGEIQRRINDARFLRNTIREKPYTFGSEDDWSKYWDDRTIVLSMKTRL